MATDAITPDHDVVTCEIFIAAPPARVFQAITDPRQLPQWWGTKEIYRVTSFESDLRVHGKWASKGVSNNGETFQVSGEYLEVDPPASPGPNLEVQLRWRSQDDGSLGARAAKRAWPASQRSATRRHRHAGQDSTQRLCRTTQTRPRVTARDGSACWHGCKPSSRKDKPSTLARDLDASPRLWRQCSSNDEVEPRLASQFQWRRSSL